MTFKYKLIRSKRRTISIEVTPDCRVLVRAPKWVSNEEIEGFLVQRHGWIQKQLSSMKEAKEKLERYTESTGILTEEELARLKEEARADLESRVSIWYEKVFKKEEPKGVQLSFFDVLGIRDKLSSDSKLPKINKIVIRSQRSRWGSCSRKGNLNFNCLLMLAPEDVRDYVVVHELCHLIHMDHSPMFWKEVERVLPDYKRPNNWLNKNGSLLMARLTNNKDQ